MTRIFGNMSKKFHLIFILIFLLVVQSGIYIDQTGLANINPTETVYVPSAVSSSEVIHDGIISPGEYDGFALIDSASSFYVYYALNQSVIYLAMAAKVAGYVSIGLNANPSTKMAGADIYIGYVDATGAYIQDNIGTGAVSHAKDSVENILSYGGSANSSTTLLEFSRLLDTGDSQDYKITPNVKIDIMWAVSTTADDFTSYHTSRGYSSLTFSTVKPQPPSVFTTNSSDSTIGISWKPPRDGGSPITQYKVYSSSTSGLGYTLSSTVTSASAIISGLTNGQTYYFVVTAINSLGESIYSKEFSAVPSGTITEPLNPSAVGGLNKITLSWDPPSLTGGKPLTKYGVYRSDSASGTFVKIGENTTKTGYIDLDVINGKTYYYKITAYNSFQESTFSTMVSTFSTGAPPTISSLIGFASNNTVILNWTSPATDGGFTFVGYNVYRSITSGSSYTKIATNISSLSFVDSSVVNLKTYFYVVTSLNQKYESGYSNEIKLKVANTPYAPQIIDIQSANNLVYLSWSKPFDNSYPILHYSVYRSISDPNSFVWIGNTSLLNYTDNGVTNKDHAYYKVSATNNQGEGLASKISSLVVGGVPSAPRSISGVVSDKANVVSWLTPFDDGGFVIQGYTIFRSNNSVNFYRISNITGISYKDTNLVNGITYQYKVSAYNSKGYGMNSSSINLKPGRASSTPTNVTLELFSNHVLIKWNSPNDTGGYPILKYNIYRGLSGNAHLIGFNNSGTNYRDYSIAKGVNYTYFVTAVTILGQSSTSELKSVITTTAPSPPLPLTAKVNGTQVLLSWSAPTYDGGRPVLYYLVYQYVVVNQSLNIVGNVTSLQYRDVNLTRGQNYTYWVQAFNSEGASPLSNSVDVHIATLKVNVVASQISKAFFDNRQVLASGSIFISIGLIALTVFAIRRINKPSTP